MINATAQITSKTATNQNGHGQNGHKSDQNGHSESPKWPHTKTAKTKTSTSKELSLRTNVKLTDANAVIGIHLLLGQCITLPRHVLPVSRYGYGSISGSPPKFNHLFTGANLL